MDREDKVSERKILRRVLEPKKTQEKEINHEIKNQMDVEDIMK